MRENHGSIVAHEHEFVSIIVEAVGKGHPPHEVYRLDVIVPPHAPGSWPAVTKALERGFEWIAANR